MVVAAAQPRRRRVRRARANPRQLALPGAPPDHWRPQTRADCAGVERPCRYVSCRHNLYLDVTMHNGLPILRVRFPGREPEDMPADGSCALDVAERLGGLTLEEVGLLMNLTPQAIQIIESDALPKLRDPLAHVRDEPAVAPPSLPERIERELEACAAEGVSPTTGELRARMGIGVLQRGDVHRARFHRALASLVEAGRAIAGRGEPRKRRYWIATAPMPIGEVMRLL